MSPFFILMLVFGGCIFLYGLYLLIDKHPLIPKYYQKTVSKNYRFYLGKTVMLVSLSPILAGAISCLGDSTLIVISSMLTLILSFILFIYIAIHYFKK